MFPTFLTFALLVAPAIADISINTPRLQQCQPAKISWSPSSETSQYNLLVTSADDPCGTPLADLGDHTSTVYNWNVNIAAGTQVQVSVADENDDEGWSGIITVADSDDTSCLKNALASPVGSSSASGEPSAATTLIVTPTEIVQAAGETPTGTVPGSTGSSDGNNSGLGSSIGGVGNAGANPYSGASALRQATTPALAFSAFVAIVMASL